MMFYVLFQHSLPFFFNLPVSRSSFQSKSEYCSLTSLSLLFMRSCFLLSLDVLSLHKCDKYFLAKDSGTMYFIENSFMLFGPSSFNLSNSKRRWPVLVDGNHLHFYLIHRLYFWMNSWHNNSEIGNCKISVGAEKTVNLPFWEAQ